MVLHRKNAATTSVRKTNERRLLFRRRRQSRASGLQTMATAVAIAPANRMVKPWLRMSPGVFGLQAANSGVNVTLLDGLENVEA
jgi:anti-sigma-K factor RskA